MLIIDLVSVWLDDLILTYVSTLLNFGREYCIHSNIFETDVPKVLFGESQYDVTIVNPNNQTRIFS